MKVLVIGPLVVRPNTVTLKEAAVLLAKTPKTTTNGLLVGVRVTRASVMVNAGRRTETLHSQEPNWP
jgi:hypothetical protein